MKIRNVKPKMRILLVVASVVVAGILMYWYGSGTRTAPVAQDGRELTLARPVFDSSVGAAATTLVEEAGMSMWLNATANAPLQLTDAASGMVNIEVNTTEYVIGSISLQSSGFDSDDWPHCFVHKNGWVVVYYLKVNPANPSTAGWIGKMIALSSSDWYDRTSHLLKDTLLHKALVLIGYQLGISDTSSAQYYHFQYPSATTLELAIKAVGNGETATFNIMVPGSFRVDDRSWSFYNQRGGSFRIGDTQIPVVVGRNYGGPQITVQELPPDSWRTVTISSQSSASGNFATVCIIVLYH